MGQKTAITCSHYEAPPNQKHCRDYKDGDCLKFDAKCTEWLKANGAPEAIDYDLDLFGNPVPRAKPPKRETPAPTQTPAPPAETPDESAGLDESEQLRGLTTEDIESFKALGLEVRLESTAVGTVWLVPEYTEQDRKEVTPEDVAALALTMNVFSGAKVMSFEKAKEIQS